MQVKNLMTQPPQTCPVTMRLAAVSRRMRETGCGTVWHSIRVGWEGL